MSRVFVVGTIAKEADVRVFGNGGKAATIFVEERCKSWDRDAQKMVDASQVVELEVINSKSRPNADNAIKIPVGTMVVCEAQLRVDTWKDARNGEMRSKQKVMIDDIHVVGQQQATGQAPRQDDLGDRF